MRNWRAAAARLAAVLLGVDQVRAAGYADFDPDSPASIKKTSLGLAEDMLSFYNGDQPGGTPGLLPQPYYWWEGGAMMGALIDYWYYTRDDRYNDLTTEGLLLQASPTKDYMPENQTLTEGNDDQGFWGMAVMSAAEYNFPNPPADQPQWLALAQAVFNTQAARWDTEHCGGGLRWQIFTWNAGFDYKNSISQGCFFNIAARLALYTKNSSYADWADKTWDWMREVNFMKDNYDVIDGAHTGTGCTDFTPYQFSYNAGVFLLGAAAMYNYTDGAQVWKDRVDGLLKAMDVFFRGPDKNIMTEVACETVERCNLDQQSFKAYLSRWMAATTKWAPYTYDVIKPLLRASSVAAAAQCTGGNNGRMCGLKWGDNGTWDKSQGVGQQMAAMEIVLANMIQEVEAPVTEHGGGTSKGDAGAGGSDIGRTDANRTPDERYGAITKGDVAGAAVLTAVVVAVLIGFMVFMLMDETSDRGVQERWGDLRTDVETCFTGPMALGLPFVHKPPYRAGRDPNRTMAEKGKAGGVFDGPASTPMPIFQSVRHVAPPAAVAALPTRTRTLTREPRNGSQPAVQTRPDPGPTTGGAAPAGARQARTSSRRSLPSQRVSGSGAKVLAKRAVYK